MKLMQLHSLKMREGEDISIYISRGQQLFNDINLLLLNSIIKII